MATYKKAPIAVPSSQRYVRITAIAEGDQIDVLALLGRPAQGLRLYTSATTDSVTYKLNSLVHLPKDRRDSVADVRAYMKDIVDVWMTDSVDSIVEIGKTIDSPLGLPITSFELIDVTLGTGSTISALVW